MIVELNINDVWTDISDSVRRKDSRLQFVYGTEEMRYAPDMFDFQVSGKDVDLIKRFFASHKKIEVRVFADPVSSTNSQNTGERGELLFFGDIDSENEISISDNFGDLKLRAKDVCQRLDKRNPSWAFIDEDLKTLAETICAYCEVEHSFPNELSNTTVNYFVVIEDDDDCLRILNNLLWEFGYNMYADPSTGVTARSWWRRTALEQESSTIINDASMIEPLEYEEGPLDFQILVVEWTIAGNTERNADEVAAGEKCQSGMRLYLNPNVGAISAGEYFPADGLLNKKYQRYNSKTGDLLPGGDQNKTRIIYARDQCVYFRSGWREQKDWNSLTKEQRDKITANPELAASEDFIEWHDDDSIKLIKSIHEPLRSRILFQNTAKANSNDPNTNNVGARELRGFEIRGSAIYSQGTGKSTVGIFADTESHVIDSVTRRFDSISITFENTVSSVDNYYNGYIITTPHGTNAKVVSYAGSPFFTARITDLDSVSDHDTAGTKATLISPDEGVEEEKVRSDYIFSADDGNNLTEGIKNNLVFGRYTYAYEYMIKDNHPKVGSLIRLQYEKYGIDVFAVVFEYAYVPDDIDRPKVRIRLRRVVEWRPERAKSLVGDLDPVPEEYLNTPDVRPPGVETVYAVTDSPSIESSQLPKDSWGLETPGISDGVEWQNEHPLTE